VGDFLPYLDENFSASNDEKEKEMEKKLNYTLMHKNIPVVDIFLSEKGSLILEIGEIYNPERSPLLSGGVDIEGINLWWHLRSIPLSRDGLNKALHILNVDSPKELLEKSLGLSLSDHYWIMPKGASLKWEDVNFFHNDFSDDVGMALLGNEPMDKEHLSLTSPDNTSDGVLRKRWFISEGKRILMKGVKGYFQQEPFNEVVSSGLLHKLNINHVPYTLYLKEEKPYSLCENFVTPLTELIPAWYIRNASPQKEGETKYTHFIRCCEKLEVPDVQDFLDRMLTFDYIIANEDRHWGNFGFIREAETLKFKGCFPIFDNGTSLWHDTENVGKEVMSLPFKNSHKKQIELVENVSWFNSQVFNSIEEIVMPIFALSKTINEQRAEKICNNIVINARDIEQFKSARR